jgi:hypothetical protein
MNGPDLAQLYIYIGPHRLLIARFGPLLVKLASFPGFSFALGGGDVTTPPPKGIRKPNQLYFLGSTREGPALKP